MISVQTPGQTVPSRCICSPNVAVKTTESQIYTPCWHADGFCRVHVGHVYMYRMLPGVCSGHGGYPMDRVV